ncbi:Endonuclease/exonuclease/phosphatase [Lineolata rhizophorae]|uniref:Endonuclease/exonuclease/phosphatase n=1 Tax=Lineolata rhizophorae TaxID=578093 RepID=A0A6A6NR13_9PEZI|nr:Endonuclease/exonuclease/phosphatase [Lineolata rhizophorae]
MSKVVSVSAATPAPIATAAPGFSSTGSVPLPGLTAYVLTFNCARNPVSPAHLSRNFFVALPASIPADLAAHRPASSASGSGLGASASNSLPLLLPDLVAVSLQEIAPIAAAFLGGRHLKPYYDAVGTSLHEFARTEDGELYELLAAHNVGMTALLVFVRAGAAAAKVRWVQTAEVGVGLWGMGNKGAIGVRIGCSVAATADEGVDEEETQITFLAAHMAPMENGIARRNEDWANIARNLVFVDPDADARRTDDGASLSESAQARHRRQLSAEKSSRLYNTTSHVVVAGDLNYRTASHSPSPSDYRTYPQPVKSADDPAHFSHWLVRDQLRREMRAGHTMQGFVEAGPIEWPPTYKWKTELEEESPSEEELPDAGEDHWPWAKHRYPSWCDRILYLPFPAPLSAPSEPEPAPAPSASVPLSYGPLPLQPGSDHLPVAASFYFAPSAPLQTAAAAADADLRAHPPFPLAPDWRARRAAARRRELVVGALAWLAMTRDGVAVLLGTVVGAVGVAWAVGWLVGER